MPTSSPTFKTGSQLVGTVLAYTSITAQTSATFQGGLLARDGAVTLDTNTNTITAADCAAASSGGTTSAPGGTTSAPIGSTTTTPSAGPYPTLTGAGPGSPTGTPAVTPGSPPGTPAGAPGSPGRAGAPSGSTPRTPSISPPPSPPLAATGAPTDTLLGKGLVLLVLGGFALLAGRRSPKAQVA